MIKEIENNLTGVTNAMFRTREQWYLVTDEMKEKNAFIINRYMSKKYPKHAMELNIKGMSKIMIVNMWYAFMKKQSYPNFLWSKSTIIKDKQKDLFSEKEINMLLKFLDIKMIELNYLIQFHLEDVKEDLKYLISLEKSC